MKANQDSKISIERLKEFERLVIPVLLKQPEKWKTLDVDYHPPRVERLFLEQGNGYRIYLHVIHKTDEECLYHKHKWPAVLKQVYGSYRMGITYSEKEVGSKEAHSLPDLACMELAAGSYYEMTQTDALHYVKPISPFSCSIMLTNDLYPEHVFRKEAVSKELKELSQMRKLEILDMFQTHMDQ
jgi:hypothetical protein